jgi:hypothetical protein
MLQPVEDIRLHPVMVIQLFHARIIAKKKPGAETPQGFLPGKKSRFDDILENPLASQT